MSTPSRCTTGTSTSPGSTRPEDHAGRRGGDASKALTMLDLVGMIESAEAAKGGRLTNYLPAVASDHYRNARSPVGSASGNSRARPGDKLLPRDPADHRRMIRRAHGDCAFAPRRAGLASAEHTMTRHESSSRPRLDPDAVRLLAQ